MKIIISPAKKMQVDIESLDYETLPAFCAEANELLNYLRNCDYQTLKHMWKCNDAITKLNYERLHTLECQQQLTPALFAYIGIQYQYIAPAAFELASLNYLQEHLCILSGLYGVLRPLDGILPYRLEMQAKINYDKYNSLYDFWHDKIASFLLSDNNCIINLASKEYSRCITKYLMSDTKFITCVFGEKVNGKIVEKGTYAKMARGEMVRFMAEQQIEDEEQLKKFNRLGYNFNVSLSTDNTFVFVKGDI